MADSKTTLVALPRDPTSPWMWLPSAALVVEQGDFEAMRLACRGQPVALAVPTEAVDLLPVELPIKNLRELERALPFALEERLIDDVADLHFVVGERAPAPGLRHIAVVNFELAQGWLKPLRAAGLRLQAVLPDVLLLPWQTGEWTLHASPGRLLVRHGLGTGVALEPAVASLWLPRLIREQGAPSALKVYSHDAELTDIIERFAADHALTVDAQPWGELLVLGRSAQADAAGINLQQGRLRQALKGSGRLWAAAAAIAVLAFGLQCVGLYLRIQSLEGKARELSIETETRFRAAFPEVRRVVNLRVQAEQSLAALARGQRSVQDFLGLLAQGGPALSQPDGPQLLTLDFRGGRMEVDIEAPNMPSVEACQQSLKGAGLEVEVVSADNRPNGVQSRLRIRGGGA